MKNTVLRLQFSHSTLRNHTLTCKILSDALLQFPEGTSILSIGVEPHQAATSAILYNEKFEAVPEGNYMESVTVTISGEKVTLNWPDSYKKNHECTWLIFQGLLSSKEYCGVCGKDRV